MSTDPKSERPGDFIRMPEGRTSLRVDEIADWLSCSTRHIQLFIEDGSLKVLPGAKKKTERRVSCDELKRWLISRLNQPKQSTGEKGK